MALVLTNSMRPNLWKCATCDNILSDVGTKSKRRKYCDACKQKTIRYKNTAEYRKGRLVPVNCEYCEKQFMPRRRGVKYCSKLCNWRSYNNVVIRKNCERCGCIIQIPRGRKKYCTRKCNVIAAMNRYVKRNTEI